MLEKKLIRDKPLILIFADYYLPGYKSGGGMRTIVNMVDRLKDEYDFWIVTRDHDGKLDKKQYTTVSINNWNDVRGAKVFYLSKDQIRISKLRDIILEVKPDSIYLNSFFATLAIYVLKLRKLKLVPNLNVVIAPCGELSDGALKLKPTKKKIFLNLAKVSKLYKNVIWKASNNLEKDEIARLNPSDPTYFLAADLPPRHINRDYKLENKIRKHIGEAKMIFLSRFMRKKNFKWLLENLDGIIGNLTIDIYGPLEDREYWEQCENVIRDLPENISISAKGSIPHEDVLTSLEEYHFFIMPTLGENFGHIFLEALACGSPLIISDRTPWRDLEKKGIGWDLSLNEPKEWNRVINHCIDLDQLAFETLSNNSRKFLVDWLKDERIEEDTVRVLKESLKY